MTEAESPLLLKKSLVALDAPGHDKVAPDNQEKFKSAETKIKQSKLRSLFSKASFTVRTRFLVLVISVLAITATRSNDLTFNFTVICMTSNSSFNNDPPLLMSGFDISLIFGASGFGAIIALFPVIFALHQFGARYVLGVLMLMSSVATLLMPFAGRVEPMWMIPFRAVQGMGIAVVMPILGYISGNWSPVDEIGNFVTVLSTAGQLSQIFTMPASAQLCVSTGWSSVYFAHGLLSFIVAILFIAYFRNDPRKHPLIKEEELFKITQGEKKQSRKERRVPYIAIAKSKAAWAIWVAFTGNTFAFQLIVQFMPTYLNKVMDLGIQLTGMAAIIPPISQLVIKVIAGIVSDRITCISVGLKTKSINPQLGKTGSKKVVGLYHNCGRLLED
ncbi:hypothetical protein L596_014687 [Steinernema carpocapsae]|uniref:Major facilitator superfamily (MFS) profile domain-containing protein n=1 Tax=Steinernema carpocapsae TaxID=34508 RepID=A0A4U5ND51_STECR|nr:hypothetical protein L596_014687 [Steinernema carpocapsae]